MAIVKDTFDCIKLCNLYFEVMGHAEVCDNHILTEFFSQQRLREGHEVGEQPKKEAECSAVIMKV